MNNFPLLKALLFESESDFQKYLFHTPQQDHSYVLPLADLSQSLINSASQKGYLQAPSLDMDELRRQQLVKDYINLIGRINRDSSSRLWWATDFSSKNRFVNALPAFLHQLLIIKHAIKSIDHGTIAICPIPWQLRSTLRKFFFENGIASVEYFSRMRQWRIVGTRFVRLAGAHLFHGFRTLMRRSLSRWVLGSKFKRILNKIEPKYVIKNFIYTHSFTKEDGKFHDIFFGILPEYLQTQGKAVVVFANVLGDFRICLQKILECPNAVIVPLEHFLRIRDILWDNLQIAFFRPSVKGVQQFHGFDITSIIKQEMICGAGKIQPYQFIHYSATKGLINHIKAETFLMTYENNPWEKMCTLALRKFSPETKIRAYQHTVNPQASTNMFHSLAEEKLVPVPDKVFSLGDISKQIIATYSTSTLPTVEPACALQFAHLWKLPSYPRTRTKTILVGLEGIMEAYRVINYVLTQLRNTSRYKVILRAHPVLPIKAMESRLVVPLNEFPYIEVSKGKTLLEDIERTDLMMYWGSMAALEAQWMGKPLIHYDMRTMFSYDPLFNSQHFKWVVNDDKDLPLVLEQIYHLADGDYAREYLLAKQYLEHYFAKVEEDKLARFL